MNHSKVAFLIIYNQLMFDLCIFYAFRANLVYTMSPRPARAAWQNPVSKQTKTTTKSQKNAWLRSYGDGVIEQRPRSFISRSSGLAFVLDWILPLGPPNCTPVKSANNF